MDQIAQAGDQWSKHMLFTYMHKPYCTQNSQNLAVLSAIGLSILVQLVYLYPAKILTLSFLLYFSVMKWIQAEENFSCNIVNE